MFRLLLTAFLIYSVSCDQVVINDAIDQLLESGKTILKAKGQDQITVPNIDKTFQKKIYKTLKITGEFHASGGVFKDTTSIHRTGDVTMKTEGNKLTLGVSMGLSQLDVDFNHYSFKLLAIHSEGSIHASCRQNSITAVFTIIHDGQKCTVDLEKAQIDSLGGFDVKMTGPGDINQLGTMLFTWVLNQFNDLIKGVINSHLQNALKEALNKVDLCKKLPF